MVRASNSSTPLFTQCFTEASELGGVAGPLVLKVFAARKVLPSGCFAPALDDVFVAFVEGVLEVQQGHHQPVGQAWTTGVGDYATDHASYWTEQIQVFDLLASFDLPCPALSQRCFDLLPGHAVGQDRQRVAQVDHLIEPVAEEVVGHGVLTPQKSAYIEYLSGSSDYPDSPQITCVHAGSRGFSGATTYFFREFHL